jgi:hypothetical protein
MSKLPNESTFVVFVSSNFRPNCSEIAIFRLRLQQYAELLFKLLAVVQYAVATKPTKTGSGNPGGQRICQ